MVKIKVAKSAGVLIGDGNRQLNNYRFLRKRPRVSLDHLLEGNAARMRSLAKLVANPNSMMANYAFRRKLSASGAPSSRVLFADTSRPATVRISARVDESGSMVVQNSRGVVVGNHSTQRNNFSYRTVGHELSLEGMLRDRPDLVRSLAMTVRHPDNPAVRRSFTSRISHAYIHGSGPSLSVLSQEWATAGLSVNNAAGVTVGAGNSRTDKISVKLGRIVMTGWDGPVKQVKRTIDGPEATGSPANGPAATPGPADLGPAISSPFSLF